MIERSFEDDPETLEVEALEEEAADQSAQAAPEASEALEEEAADQSAEEIEEIEEIEEEAIEEIDAPRGGSGRDRRGA